MAGVSLHNIGKTYGKVTAVKNFNLEIEDKEFIVLVGPSGCGKSAVLRMIAGLDDVTEGEILIDDRHVNNVAAKNRDVAMVFRKCALVPRKTVYDNLAYGLKGRKASKSEIDSRVREVAQLLDIEALLPRKAATLSDGECQRVSLGRAMVRQPKVFLLDEPLNCLDSDLRARTRSELLKLHKKLGATMIYITNDQTEAMTLGTRIVVMSEGEIAQQDTPQNLYDYPANVSVAKYIGSPRMNLFKVKLANRGDGVYAEFGENAIRVPTGKIQRMTGDYIGKQVYMGIRPENLHDEASFISTFPDAAIEVSVEMVELMGHETYLHLKAEGWDREIIARVDPRTSARLGDRITIGFDVNRLHFFDVESEKTILSRD